MNRGAQTKLIFCIVLVLILTFTLFVSSTENNTKLSTSIKFSDVFKLKNSLTETDNLELENIYESFENFNFNGVKHTTQIINNEKDARIIDYSIITEIETDEIRWNGTKYKLTSTPIRLNPYYERDQEGKLTSKLITPNIFFGDRNARINFKDTAEKGGYALVYTKDNKNIIELRIDDINIQAENNFVISNPTYSNQTDGFDTSSAEAIHPEGVTTNGSDFWVTDNSPTYIFHFSADGTELVGFNAYGDHSTFGITMNNSNFWVSSNVNNPIYYYDKNGNNLGNWDISNWGTGNKYVYDMTTNNSDFWVYAYGENFIYHSDSAGNNQTDGFSTSHLASTYNIKGITSNITDIWAIDTIANWIYHINKSGYNFTGTLSEAGFSYANIGSTDAKAVTTKVELNGGSPVDFWIIDKADSFIYHISTTEYIDVNATPIVNLQAPENNTQLTPGSVEFIYNVTDPDSDNVDNCSLWLNKNQTGFELIETDPSITQTINQSFTKSLSKGNYIWRVKCYDSNTKLGESTIFNLTISGINNPPTINIPSISPDPAYTDSTLNCSVIAYDIDLDSITINFTWYNGATFYGNESKITQNGILTYSYLSPGEQNKDETWNCTVRGFDGENYTNYESDTITISNTAPTHSNPVLSSTTNYNASNEDLTCYNQSTQDIDNDIITNIYSWYLNSNPLAVLNLPFESNTDDYSGSDNDGTISGNPQYKAGKYGNALEFDGIDDKVTAGDLGIPANGPATIEAWFYFKQLAQGSSHKGLYSILYQHSADNNLYFLGTNDLFYVSSNLQLNTWHHIVLTYSGDTSTAKLYIDNTQYNPAIQGGAETIPALDNFIVADTGSGLFFNGTIDEVKVYNRVLSQEEISSHYNLNYDKTKSSETSEDDVWKCKVTPNDASSDGTTLESNTVTIKPNVYDITFNITEGEYGNDLTGVLFACDNGFSTTTSTNPETHKFYEGSYSCEFSDYPVSDYYNRTKTFTADNDKQLDIIMSYFQDMTIQEHNWLEAIYTCLYEGNCYTLDLLEEINETTQNLWDQFKPTDESVVIQENIISNELSSTQNITINYTIKAPPKAGYSTGDYAPMKIAFWFLDTNNQSCLDQDKQTDSNRAEKTYCIPLIAETLAIVNQEVNFLVELRPDLPAGSYSIVRDIEIDPNEVWIKYGQEIIDSINILESNNNPDIFLTKNEIFDEGIPEHEVKQASELSYVTGSATSDTTEETTQEIKSILSGSQVVGIIGMIFALLTVIIICFTIYKIKTKI